MWHADVLASILTFRSNSCLWIKKERKEVPCLKVSPFSITCAHKYYLHFRNRVILAMCDSCIHSIEYTVPKVVLSGLSASPCPQWSPQFKTSFSFYLLFEPFSDKWTQFFPLLWLSVCVPAPLDSKCELWGPDFQSCCIPPKVIDLTPRLFSLLNTNSILHF